jgi:hypothetical protein
MPTISFNATTGPRALAVTPSEDVLVEAGSTPARRGMDTEQRDRVWRAAFLSAIPKIGSGGNLLRRLRAIDLLPPGICVLAHQRFGQLAGPPDWNGTEWALDVLAVELLEGYEVWLGRVAQEHRV